VCELFLGMGKKGEFVGDIDLGTDNWNVAIGYSNLKILKLLVQLDDYDTLAQFGTKEMNEDIPLSDMQIKKRRVEALERLHQNLRLLIGNTLFALKSNDVVIAKQYLDRVKSIENYLSNVYDSDEDEVSYDETFEINEKLFKIILETLRNIKDNINIVLNRANLIFRQSEDIDLDKLTRDIIEGG